MKSKLLKILCVVPIVGLPIITACADNSKCTITIKLNNLLPDYQVTAYKNTKINLPTPTKERCIFQSWQIVKEDGTKEDFDIQNTPVTGDITLSAHYKYDHEHMHDEKPDVDIRAEGTNLRVMSFNMLVGVYDNHPRHHGYGPRNEKYTTPPEIGNGRDEQAFRTIKRYKPDVIGLQEIDQTSDLEAKDVKDDIGWYDAFKEANRQDTTNFPYKIVSDGARKRVVGDKGEQTVFSTIAYNTNVLEIAKDEQQHELWGTNLSRFYDNVNCRWLTWCVLQTKSEPAKKFLVTSTHWNLDRSEKAGRLAQAAESAIWTTYQKQRFGDIPAISCGDYNKTELTPEYAEYLRVSGFQETKYTAKKHGFVGSTGHLGPEGFERYVPSRDADHPDSKHWWRDESTVLDYRADSVVSIDHIFTSKEVVCNYYNVITETPVLYASDHFPSYADLTI